MHNIWFQQYGKKGACLYIATLDDYVWTFKHSTLYYHFKKGGPSGQGLGRSAFFLWKTTQFGDLKYLVNVILKYALSSYFKIVIAHMEGEEILGSCK